MWYNLERRFGRFAIPNITVYLIACEVVAFVLAHRNPNLFEKLSLIPSRVMDGEVFRLISFLAIPPGDNLFWAFFAWYLFYLMGTALEQYWGTFRYNVYLLTGYFATVAAAFVTPDLPAGNWFVEGTVFLAFAYLNPNFQLMIMFILPVRIKWFALLTWIGLTFVVITGDWNERLAALASVLNFFLFFGSEIKARIKGKGRSMSRQAKQFTQKPERFFHQCATCGITDADNPKLDFRYCSSCEGDLCYCETHLRDHEHVVR